MASILVIGVGSTGLSAMEQAQQFYYEFTKKNSPGPNNSAFLYLETDRNRLPKVTPNGGTDIQASFLCPQNINATITNWQGKYAWMPSTAQVLNTHSGAAGQPAFGRVALWSEEQFVRNIVQALYNQINGNAQTNIYLVGSLTGGTGTGIFLDLAYLIRQITNNNNIYGMFMLPDKNNVGQTTKDVIYENAYTSLFSIDKYSKANIKTNTNYQCVLPGGTDISNLSAPFYNVQFFTQDFSDATASTPNIEHLVQSTGFNLALRMLDVNNQQAPFQNLINARLVDYTSHVPNGIFTTIGLNVFQYPEALLEEYFTTKQLEETMLKRWADTTNFIDQHGTVSAIATITSRIKLEAVRFVHEAIENAVEKCKGGQILGKATFHAALQAELDTIQSGNYQAPSLENYLYSLFNADSNQPRFYAAISGHSTSLRDELVIAVANKIGEISSQYQNLEIVKIWLEHVVNALDAVLKDWKQRYKLDGTPNQWNQSWKNQYELRLAHNQWFYAMMAAKREWFAEAIEGVASLCYYNAFVPMIQQIIQAINNVNGIQGLATATGISIPTMQNLSEIVKKVQTLLDAQQDESLTNRKNCIYGQLTNNSHPQFHFLFAHGSCANDVQSAEGKYHNLANRLAFKDICGDTLWSFLKNNDCVAIRALMIKQGLLYFQPLALFAANNTDVVQIMQNLQPHHPAYNKAHTLLNGIQNIIQQDAPAMVSLIGTEQFQPHNCLKLIIASPYPETAGIVPLMQNYHPTAVASNYVQLPSMNNTVVVYQEYGYLGAHNNGAQKAFNPLIHLSYQSQVLNAIKNKVENKNFDDSVRLAYVTAKELINTNDVNIK